ncbi:Chitin synthase [compost metagenome]
MGGVAGRTDVENKYTNALTKLQTVRYYIAFRIMKAAESWFDSVTCLSGPLSCYRKDLIIKHSDAWLNQKFLGQPATFGGDRSMTNFILQTHRTAYQDSAICSTIVPSDNGVFLKQQMRWKRSWLRESLRAAGFIWRKEPFMALFFYIGLIVPIAAPVVVLYNLVFVPLFYGIFPGTFLMGLLLMALLMSLAHLLFRKSKLWVFGFVFCIFYEFVLLWQMPVAWVTFWKSTWGTRETPQDIEARLKKEARKQQRLKQRNKNHTSSIE